MGRDTKDVAQPWYSDGRRAEAGEHDRQRWVGDAVSNGVRLRLSIEQYLHSCIRVTNVCIRADALRLKVGIKLRDR